MDAVIFFIPVALIVAQYLMPAHTSSSSVARDSARTDAATHKHSSYESRRFDFYTVLCAGHAKI